MEKVTEMLRGFTTKELVEQFEATTDNNDENIYTVRGWLMDEIESRNPEGYDKWLDSEECDDSELKNYVL